MEGTTTALITADSFSGVLDTVVSYGSAAIPVVAGLVGITIAVRFAMKLVKRAA